MTVFIGTIVVPKKGRVRGNGIISNKGDCLRRYSQHLLGTTNRSLIIFPIPPPPVYSKMMTSRPLTLNCGLVGQRTQHHIIRPPPTLILLYE